MIYFYLVISGVILGLIAAVPIGPVNLICIRRTLLGPPNGFVSGLGAALGDGIFAAITGFGLTWIAQLIEGYATIIELIGGAMMVWMGYRTFVSPPVPRCVDVKPDSEGTNLMRATVSTFALTVTNPVTLLSFGVMFASLGGLAGGAGSFHDASFVVAGVVGGSAGWWLALTTVIGLFHTKIDESVMRMINRICGVLVMACGLVVLTHLAIKYSSNGRNPLSSAQFRPTSAVSGLGMTSPLI
jgi:threonine/homoserine/homoserine lactone efflux protein